MAAAKEFNIGKETLVEFLAGKGFSRDDLKPTSKLSEDMYRSLQQEFNSDKVAKIKSDQIDLPKGGAADGRKKRDEEDLSFKKEPVVVKKVVKEEKPVAPVAEEVKQPVAPPPPPPIVKSFIMVNSVLIEETRWLDAGHRFTHARYIIMNWLFIIIVLYIKRFLYGFSSLSPGLGPHMCGQYVGYY